MKAYVATNITGDAVRYVQEQLERWDDQFYQRHIDEKGMEAVIQEDWEKVWGPGKSLCTCRACGENEVFSNVAGARKQAKEYGKRYVVKITPDVLRVAYTNVFKGEVLITPETLRLALMGEY